MSEDCGNPCPRPPPTGQGQSGVPTFGLPAPRSAHRLFSLRVRPRLAWISTEWNSPHTMSLESTIFRAFRSETAEICYAIWCADSLVARRHFALSRFDFRSFRASVGKMTPGRGGYQSTNPPYTNE